MTNSIHYICSLIVVFTYPITFTFQTVFSQVQVQSLEPKPLIVNTFPYNLRKPRNIVFRFFNFMISRPTPFNFSCKNGYTPLSFFQPLKLKSLIPVTKLARHFTNFESKPSNITQNIYLYRFSNLIKSRPKLFNFSCKYEFIPLFFYQSLKLKYLIFISKLVSKPANQIIVFESKPLNITQNLYKYGEIVFQVISCFSLEPESVSAANKSSRSNICTYTTKSFLPTMCKKSNHTRVTQRREHSSHSEIYLHRLVNISLRCLHVIIPNMIARFSSKIQLISIGVYIAKQFVYYANLSRYLCFYYSICIYSHLYRGKILAPHMIVRSLTIVYYFSSPPDNKRLHHKPKDYSSLSDPHCFLTECCCFIVKILLLFYKKVIAFLSKVYYFSGKILLLFSLKLIAFPSKSYCLSIKNLLLFYKKFVALLLKIYCFLAKSLLLPYQKVINFLSKKFCFYVKNRLLFSQNFITFIATVYCLSCQKCIAIIPRSYCFSSKLHCFSVKNSLLFYHKLIASLSIIYCFSSKSYCFSPPPNNKKIYYKNPLHVVKYLPYTNTQTLDIHPIAAHKYISHTFYKCFNPLKCVVMIVIKFLCY